MRKCKDQEYEAEVYQLGTKQESLLHSLAKVIYIHFLITGRSPWHGLLSPYSPLSCPRTSLTRPTAG